MYPLYRLEPSGGMYLRLRSRSSLMSPQPKIIRQSADLFAPLSSNTLGLACPMTPPELTPWEPQCLEPETWPVPKVLLDTARCTALGLMETPSL